MATRKSDLGKSDERENRLRPLEISDIVLPQDPSSLPELLRARLVAEQQPVERLKLAAGPVLRAAWIPGREVQKLGIKVRVHDQKIRLRYWLELWEFSTSCARHVDFGKDFTPTRTIMGTDLIRLPGDRGKLDPRLQWRDFEIDKYRYPEICLRSEGKNAPRYCEASLGSGQTPPWVERLIGHAKRPLDDFNFLVGSCRYPGTPFEAGLSDQVFNGMLDVILDSGHGIDMLFLVGDQIYADATADIFDSSTSEERYVIPYRKAFTSPNARKVLSQVPVHFAVDDHEIRDNWSGETCDGVDAAIAQARSFMGSAREDAVNAGGKSETGLESPIKSAQGSLWYALNHKSEAAFPSFVMDTRTERKSHRNPEHAELIGKKQLAAFDEWLGWVRNDPRPKFVFAGQVIAPLNKRLHRTKGLWRNEDCFVRYPQSLDAIIRMILDHDVSHLVFVGGDKHLSCAAEMVVSDKNNGRFQTVYQIVASGLYAPMPFANAKESDYDWTNQCVIDLPSHKITYLARLLTTHHSHFVKVKAEANGWKKPKMAVSAFDEDGKKIPPRHPGQVGGNSVACSMALV